MTIDSSTTTQISLILRARQGDSQEAWKEFVGRYGDRILHWCHHWCSQDADAQDMTQEILFRVWLKLPEFRHGPDSSFRGWLQKLSRRVFLSSLRRKRPTVVTDTVLAQELDKKAAEFAKSMEQQFDEELLHLACEEVRKLVDDTHWQIFDQSTFQRVDRHEVAQRYGKSPAAVRMIIVRIREQLRNHMLKIEQSINGNRS